jgi:hypothetical protein
VELRRNLAGHPDRDDECQPGGLGGGDARGAREHRHPGRVERQRRVEGELDRQRPGLVEALVEEVLDEVVVHQGVVRERAAERRQRDDAERVHADGQREPVRRKDPDRSPERVAPEIHRAAPRVQPRDERPIQEEPRDHEEEKHARVEAMEHRARPRRRIDRPVRGVMDRHAHGRDRTQAVEAGQSIARRRPAPRCHGGQLVADAGEPTNRDRVEHRGDVSRRLKGRAERHA